MVENCEYSPVHYVADKGKISFHYWLWIIFDILTFFNSGSFLPGGAAEAAAGREGCCSESPGKQIANLGKANFWEEEVFFYEIRSALKVVWSLV